MVHEGLGIMCVLVAPSSVCLGCFHIGEELNEVNKRQFGQLAAFNHPSAANKLPHLPIEFTREILVPDHLEHQRLASVNLPAGVIGVGAFTIQKGSKALHVISEHS